jgi:hypothetical protein
MSIDGIGKPIGPSAAIPAGGTAPTSGGSFEIAKTEAVSGADAVDGAASDALSALERGEISVDQYLDARVEDALGNLAGRLPPEQLEFVRAELRSALETDPVLVELVQRTTHGLTRAE